ncbi:F-box protein At3g07870-like [Salvia miltiorrhiza]|uniref:F-box protein At3g07870-like n=1 Tax=Salvia miltiorrhiza TaxID=226208 RepID=UPI0025AD1D3C|nr:F-box protein At3g07870-like [Salvia miltiorrhiza]
MNQYFLGDLPSVISFDIILRLPPRAIAISKCVCKPWLQFLEADDFVSFHLSKSAPALAALTIEDDSNWCKVFQIEDELDHGRDPLAKSAIPHGYTIGGSANGLLLLTFYPDYVYVCNPFTRELCDLRSLPKGVAYGFGASRVTGRHKVVSISPNSDCHVYTLGTGSCRRVEAAPFQYSSGSGSFGVLVNGNLHWLVSSGSVDTNLISCFDVETECFSTFPAPPLGSSRKPWRLYNVRDCLCFCEESFHNLNAAEDKINIWLVKDYEVDKSWSKQYVICQDPDFDIFDTGFLQPIKLLSNGDLLILCNETMFIYYSKESETTKEIKLLGAGEEYYSMDLTLLTPTFLSLRRSLGMENVVILI